MSETPDASLEDIMVAMDVVDTLRHRQGLVDRELNADARREQLTKKLKEIYRSQGIDVTDEMLREGVAALEDERFSHQAPKPGFSLWLAKVYITRDRWLRVLGVVAMLAAIISILYYFMIYQPQKQALAELPNELMQLHNNVRALSQLDDVGRKAQEFLGFGLGALEQGDTYQAKQYRDLLAHLESTLKESYQIRIVSEPGELSGVWRIPEVNPNARNYYLIVEAVDETGQQVPVMITNEENNRQEQVTRWGVRVDESVFEKVMLDKKADGIIQNNLVGEKRVGEIAPNYSIKLEGGSITRW